LDRLVTEPVDPERVDPVAIRRAQIARWVQLAKRTGYASLLVAIVTFAVGAATDFPGWLVDVCIGALVAAVVILPVPIVLGYGIRAAERDERAGPGH
jgi:hypothetical protein